MLGPTEQESNSLHATSKAGALTLPRPIPEYLFDFPKTTTAYAQVFKPLKVRT